MKITPTIRKQINDFLSTEAGAFVLNNFDIMIADKHNQAENDPDHARDYVQNAKGIREAKARIVGDGTVRK